MTKIIKFMYIALILIILISAPASAQESRWLPTLKEPVVVQTWLTVGPFSVGSREAYIDHLLEQGGEELIVPKEGMTHSSWMAPGGTVAWKKVTAKNGAVELAYENINWKALQDPYGWPGLANAGYAYAEYENPNEKRVLIMAEKVRTFYVNGHPFYGDVYGHGFVQVPVILKKGINRILVKVSGYENLKFSFRMLPAPEPLMINLKDITSTDLIQGENFKGSLAVPLINTTEKTLKNIKIAFGDGEYLNQTETIIALMPPLTIQKVPIPLETQPLWLQQPLQEDTLRVPITISYADQRYTQHIALRIVEKGVAFRTTFRAAEDNSVQYFAVLPPKNFDPNKSYALILSLHGAGVDAYGQVKAYAQKDWAFVVAPTNRRRFGFDWQDWGRFNALQVLEEMKKRYPIDPTRVYLTGHSMGGHGTWHVGLHHPDRFAAIAPSAGWTSFNLYVPFFLRKDYIFASPKLRTIWNMVLREDRPPVFVENALNLPVFVLQGGDDDNVPPTHARFMTDLLKRLNYEVIYKEVPGKGHWWDQEGVEGVACVDHPELMDFLRSKTRDPYPKKVVFKTIDLGLNNRLYWVEVDALEHLYQMGKIVAEVKEDDRIDITTENIDQFTLHLTPELVSEGDLRFRVNGRSMRVYWRSPQAVTMRKRGDTFRVVKPRKGGLRKTPQLYGPMKAAYFSPFIFVYGTTGSDAETALNLHLARIKAEKWWWRANGFVQIIPDKDITAAMIEKYNLILFGGPVSNSITAQINDQLPITIKHNHVFLGKTKVEGDDLAIKFLYPNPLNPKKFVLVNEGTSLEGVKLSGVLDTFYSGAGLPDYIIFDKNLKEKGWGGTLAAGFFDQNWKLTDELKYIRP